MPVGPINMPADAQSFSKTSVGARQYMSASALQKALIAALMQQPTGARLICQLPIGAGKSMGRSFSGRVL